MSMGNSPAERAIGKQHSERLMAKADADRAARLAGHKSLFWRLLERLRPHRSVDTRVGDRTRSDPSVASGVFVPVVQEVRRTGRSFGCGSQRGSRLL